MSEARIIDGKAFAADLRSRVAEDVARLKAEHGVTPGLAVVLVGEDPASQVYVRNKGEQTLAAGMHSETHRLPADVSQEELLSVVGALNADPAIHGVLVQFPVPEHLRQSDIVAAISPDKDVDGLTVTNAGRLASGLPALTPCTPLGCMMLLKDVIGDLRGKSAVVIGRSNLMGKPMAQMLLAADCTVTIAHSRSVDLPAIVRQADIVVAAVGRAEMVRGDWIKPGAVVIDVGISRFPSRDPVAAAAGKTRLVGDVAFDEVVQVAGAVTPVPGGVGPMTIACLLANTVTAAKRLNGLEV
ncbi:MULTISPECIES: bifunctional methylenetetrahydrofolate dehydrogenase/methenyltetrahydrofolate cyclohydrolase FolD [unclassified Caulobacter]|uniref:bifunctional methylenetetrahydrofolate dehydrogenase/methenyltetrahydrofolate cyclohydrolase FolD n=1 Tax=unclassified Caulobacter TaxID=2648921 RepID=UPI000D357158|nr:MULTISPECIES: bifunctional methylenetetrahydrofolate dehydrogenase/methenyltetrahydrofolate cyclohydrolase FolD [unclassified Caulobacter]PTS81702.1 bifunctional methylenetetrahydrofolate dehydrogenase/methenyltetrahydrofolate cyclohydrolase FolD [Caulobacter sp. HMWF009]PTT05501.1 bifunctional methylenetetrahydrofolate dehydrogenase/methenyltetrahydrofolate cyclohydrolase FolD [Caulobacter sp. HMWF025]